MIFVTVGTHEQPFDRLIKKIDELKKNDIVEEEFVVQIGYSEYIPKYCKWSKFFSYQEMTKYIREANIVITHGGPASFISPLQMSKIPIVVPRQEQYKEHINNHQLKFCRMVKEKMNNIILIENIDELGDAINNYNDIIQMLCDNMSSNNELFNKKLDELIKKIFGK